MSIKYDNNNITYYLSLLFNSNEYTKKTTFI